LKIAGQEHEGGRVYKWGNSLSVFEVRKAGMFLLIIPLQKFGAMEQDLGQRNGCLTAEYEFVNQIAKSKSISGKTGIVN
jgi:hypothetical protein